MSNKIKTEPSEDSKRLAQMPTFEAKLKRSKELMEAYADLQTYLFAQYKKEWNKTWEHYKDDPSKQAEMLHYVNSKFITFGMKMCKDYMNQSDKIWQFGMNM